MTTAARRLRRSAGPRRVRRHLWAHGASVLDLGDDVEAASHLRDFAAHDYALRPVRLVYAGAVEVVAYYDAEHQSALTRAQRSVIHEWLRERHVGVFAGGDGGAGLAPDGVALARAEPGAARRVEWQAGVWLAVALLPAMLAVAFLLYAVLVDGTSVHGIAPVLDSAAAVLALTSAAVTWRTTRLAGARLRRGGGASGGGGG